ncbi:hypothetical protein [Serratia fonticola]|uniref:Uncharacterized protein n=1 Tax=Serratia fonticola TaxID=47917 RepID=A0AAW3WNI5_SERFO|nr:hypothetical protein [Serratia fonticola]ALX93081.1 hypothetical protein AV650_05710 [Serratia fonticola]MBC3212503.1 hypothetical protein [Serratia fonticola]NYA13856.1 hypothetical protein [Serratia fonticola]NYA33676.1 hypothetical protein [Serratia fonticola]
MRDSKLRWFFVFLSLNLSLMIIFPLWFMLVQIGTELFHSLYYGKEFGFFDIAFAKAIKAGVFCGVLAGSGCWWIYFQRSRKIRGE